MTETLIKTEDDMLAFGAELARQVQAPCVICLKGDLGAGKTTFVRGLLRGLSYQDKVKSPTYTLVEPYNFDKFTIYHFDLYRFKDETEWDDAGFREYFNNSSICLVEWPEKAGHILPKPDISIELSHATLGRHLHLIGYSSIGAECLKAII